MTNNLGRTEVIASQNQKEVPINASDGILDAKLTQPFTADFTSGNITLTDVQWQQNGTVLCTNVSVARVLNTPLQKGFMFVDNNAGTADVTVTRGSGTVVIPAGEGRIVYQDGTTNGLVNAGGGGGGTTLVDWKDSVRVATTANITLSGEQSIDGVTTSADRVLVKNQTTGSENGIYDSAAGAWTRATDFDEDAEVTANAAMAVEEGTVNGDKIFILTTNDPITVGTTTLVFAVLGAGVTQLVLEYALSDETTNITVGTKLTTRMPFAATLDDVRASLSTASTSGVVTVDINESSVTVLSTKLTIDQDERTSETAATAAVISDSSLADDAEMTFDIDTAGTGAKGLKVRLYVTPT